MGWGESLAHDLKGGEDNDDKVAERQEKARGDEDVLRARHVPNGREGGGEKNKTCL